MRNSKIFIINPSSLFRNFRIFSVHLTLSIIILSFNNCGPAFNSTSTNTEASSEDAESTLSCSLATENDIPVGSSITGYLMSSVVFPITCGNAVTRTCLSSGQFDGVTPLAETCSQQCLHPDSNQAVNSDTPYVYFIRNSGTQAECNSARVISSCQAGTGLFSPAIPQSRYISCAVAGQTCSYPTGGGNASPNGNSVGSTVTGYISQSSTYPLLCGNQVTRTCQSNGSWGGTVPVYTSCMQKCVHPDTNMPVDQGSNYSYFSRPTGSLAECEAAERTSVCSSTTGLFSPVISSTKFMSCAPTPTVNTTWNLGRQQFSTPGNAFYSAIAASGSAVHVVRGDGTVYYRRSLNEGTTWYPEVVIGSGSTYLDNPIVADGDNVYLIYVKASRSVTDFAGPRSVGDLFFRASSNAGASWGPEQKISNNGAAFRIAITVSQSNLHVVWMDYRSLSTWDVYYNHSSNRGSNWVGELKLISGTNAMGAERPAIAASGTTVHLTWMDGRNNGAACTIEGGYLLPICTDVFYKKSTNNGTSWGADVRLSNGSTYGGRPSISADGNAVAISYDNNFDGNGVQQFFTGSTDNGVSWSLPKRLSSLATATHSSIHVVGTSIHLAWNQEDASTDEIRYRRSNDLGTSWQPEQLISTGNGPPMLTNTNNYIHILFADYVSSSRQLFYRRGSPP